MTNSYVFNIGEINVPTNGPVTPTIAIAPNAEKIIAEWQADKVRSIARKAKKNQAKPNGTNQPATTTVVKKSAPKATDSTSEPVVAKTGMNAPRKVHAQGSFKTKRGRGGRK